VVDIFEWRPNPSITWMIKDPGNLLQPKIKKLGKIGVLFSSYIHDTAIGKLDTHKLINLFLELSSWIEILGIDLLEKTLDILMTK
jgi:hypothetical protein